MPHIHTEPGHYDFTASAYIFRTDGEEPRLIMHRHRLLGKFLQFGGHVETHEHLWDAVSHEIVEESGYQMSQLRLLQPPLPRLAISDGAAHPIPAAMVSVRFGDTTHNHTDIAYAFTTDETPANLPAEGEQTEFYYCNREQIAAMTEKDTPANVREIALYIFEHCLGTWAETDPETYQRGLGTDS